MRWHKAMEIPKDGAKCLLRVILDNEKTEIRMGTALVFINSHYWDDEDENYGPWDIECVKCWCPVDEIECELDYKTKRGLSSKYALVVSKMRRNWTDCNSGDISMTDNFPIKYYC